MEGAGAPRGERRPAPKEVTEPPKPAEGEASGGAAAEGGGERPVSNPCPGPPSRTANASWQAAPEEGEATEGGTPKVETPPENVTGGKAQGGGEERELAAVQAGRRPRSAMLPTRSGKAGATSGLPPRPGSQSNRRGRLMPLVVAINSLEEAALEKAALAGAADVVCLTTSDPALLRTLGNATALIVLSLVDLPEELLDRIAPGALAVCISAMEEDADLELAEELGISCKHVGTELHREAADTAMALTLSLVRRTQTLSQAAALGGPLWAPTPLALQGCRRCAGMRMLLIMSGRGTGDVARELAVRARPFGFDISYVEAHPKEAPSDWAVEGAPKGVRQHRGGLLEAIAQADVVSMHCLLTERTGGFFGQACVDTLRVGALVVSVCSAELFDSRALKRALLEGRVGGVALDVAPAMVWGEAWLRDLSNLIITPQCSCFSDEAWRDLRLQVVGAIKGHLRSDSGLVDEDLASRDGSRPATAQDSEGQRGEGAGGGGSGGGGSSEGAGGASAAARGASTPEGESQQQAAAEGKPPRKRKNKRRGGRKRNNAKAGGSRIGSGGGSGGPARPWVAGDLVHGAAVSVWPLNGRGESEAPWAVMRSSKPMGGKPIGGWRCHPLASVTPSDPCCHFVLLRNQKLGCIGFRSGVAEGRILEQGKSDVLMFNGYGLGESQSWEVEPSDELDDLVLTNRRWRTTRRVRIVVSAMPDATSTVRSLPPLSGDERRKLEARRLERRALAEAAEVEKAREEAKPAVVNLENGDVAEANVSESAAGAETCASCGDASIAGKPVGSETSQRKSSSDEAAAAGDGGAEAAPRGAKDD